MKSPELASEPDIEYLSGTAGVAAKSVIEKLASSAVTADALVVAVFSELNREEPTQEVMLLKRHYQKEYREGADVRLGVQLLRMAGVPASIAHALELREDRGRQEPLLLVEYHDGVYWKIRDPREPNRSPNPESLYMSGTVVARPYSM